MSVFNHVLVERIRDIRSSERRFYQKVLDIYATSIDYTPSMELSQQFLPWPADTAWDAAPETIV